jgi:hypothetical protein
MRSERDDEMRANDALREAYEAVRDAMTQLGDAAIAATSRLLTIMRDAYERQGSPLGDGDVAMVRWMRMQADLEASLPERYELTDEEEDVWDAIVCELDDRGADR